MIRKLLIGILLLALTGVAAGIYLWYKPHQKVENTKGISINATELAREYSADEKRADAKYLNKAIQVSGTVSEVEQNQDGGIMVVLDTGDPMSGVQCSLREKNATITKGTQIVIKGFCSGNSITGVSLTDCVIIKNSSENN